MQSTCSRLLIGSNRASVEPPISRWLPEWIVNLYRVNRLGATVTVELDRIINPEKVRGSMKHASGCAAHRLLQVRSPHPT